MKMTVKQYFGQGLGYLLFIAFIGYFSTEPSFTNMPADQALIKFTFAHPGKRLVPCVKRSAAEMANLPPQLRYDMKCSRERAPLQVEFEIDGQMVYQKEIPAKGLKNDLPSPVYQRFNVPAGQHHLQVRMRDNVTDKEFTYAAEKTVVFIPLQVLIIDFDENNKKFTFE
jgi:hypothetical protein